MIKPFNEIYEKIGNKRIITADCANGIGGKVFRKIKPLITDKLTINLINDDINNYDNINLLCGSEFV